MTLAEFLTPLVTPTANLILKDFTTGSEIVNMKASGFSSLEASIENSEVKSWEIKSPVPSIVVTILVNG